MLLWLASACLQRPCDRQPFYEDLDGDGWGSEVSERRCEAAPHWVERTGDCDDGDLRVHPGRPEYCDGVDEDCDGQADEDAEDIQTWFHDADQDGFGDPASAIVRCEAPNNHVLDGADCDDDDPTVNPGQPELCDGVDEDCDGETDEEAQDAVPRFADEDGDGFGAEALGPGCLGEGESTLDGDCDDEDPNTFPGAAELESETECWTDADGDGYGPSDPDDSDATWFPEACDNGADDDRDGLADCEDGDCVGLPACTERCFGGDDEDVDGLVDCEDDDCWGEDDCATTWVESGQLTWQRASSQAIAHVEGVQGRATWGSGAMSCSWTVSSARMSFTTSQLRDSDLIGRVGFSGCESLTAAALPDFFSAFAGTRPWTLTGNDGVLWYTGTVTSSWTTSGWSYSAMQLSTGEPY